MRELLLIAADGLQYGIWNDEIQSVKDMTSLHRLPLSPACIAGISIIEDRTVTLADLRVCIGHSPSPDGKGHILILQGEKTAGFMLSGDIGSVSVPEDAVYPMPDYARTVIIDCCALHGGIIVPIINISILYDQLLKYDQELPRPPLAVPVPESTNISAISSVRIFDLNRQLFAASSEVVEGSFIQPRSVTSLSLVPQYVRGITCHNNNLIPVIDLPQRILRHKAKTSAGMIVAGVNGSQFGFLADQDCGTLPADAAKMSDLPAIVRSSWLRQAVNDSGRIIPVLDLARLMAGTPEHETPIAERYHPDSQFNSAFKNQDVDVVEFSLLGARHALPKSEVENDVACLHIREIPDAPEIVIGVASHEGTLLPVLDLAMVFGRRSIANSEWRMLLVKNGDFRALVITEKVFGECRLPRDIQRTVPILLPHGVVYGCYPDAQAVRLILNVEALAVHFEKSLVKEFLPSLSQDMMQAPSRVVYALIDDELRETLESGESHTKNVSDQEPVAAAVIAAPVVSEVDNAFTQESVGTISDTGEAQAEEPIKQEEIVEPAEEQKAVAAVPKREDKQDLLSGVPDIAAARIREDRTTHDIATTAEESETRVLPEEGGIVFPKTTGEETAKLQEGSAPEEAASEEVAPGPANTVEHIRIEEEVAEEKEFQPAHNQVSEEIPPHIMQQEPEPAATPETQTDTDTQPVAEPQPQSGPEFKTEQTPQPQPVIERQPQPVFAYRDTSPGPSKNGGHRFIYVAAAAIIAVLLYFTGTLNDPHIQEPLQIAEQAETVRVKSESNVQPPVEEPKPELELEIPVTRSVEIDVYVVVRADTLWGISERFTGNPFNYPRIAGENRIADPDLIFPGQKIHLKKRSMSEQASDQ